VFGPHLQPQREGHKLHLLSLLPGNKNSAP
jgi:hypothetical protein